MIRKLIIIPIYHAKIEIFIGSLNELNMKMKEIYYEELDKGTHCRSIWFETANRFWLLFRNDAKITPGMIAHECKHTVNFIFRAKGIELDIINDEIECYLLEFIIDKVSKILNDSI